ncbi:MAG: peptide ABC transporter substrate-binding protein [Chloracidobacterium sp.]|nr:peptide ABC transporter substrate-binding protein [Chloracidobacterium sp.]
MPDRNKILDLRKRTATLVSVVVAVFFITSCTQIEQPTTEPFFSGTKPPPKQEFRWSNGKMPKSFDPARAAAAPETDIVRAVFEGLTEIDAKTLEAVPAAAEKWSSSDDLREWTFHLRKDARWSNGKRLTAENFVIAWQRLGTLGNKTAHRELIQNIVGLKAEKPVAAPADSRDFQHDPVKVGETPIQNLSGATKRQEQPTADQTATDLDEGVPPRQDRVTTAKKMGIEAVSDVILKVTLELPDKDFPKLVANPIFRPVYGDGADFETQPLNPKVVTNGPFAVTEVAKDGVTLTRSDKYWDKDAVKLEQVQFVQKETAEAALDAYKKGEIHAVTNADFEPLALKLLAPFDDFRRTTHSAVNFYEVNTKNAPFNDRRVREALATSIDRDRLTDGELEGSTQPAAGFLPLGDKKVSRLVLDIEKAKGLLEKAGYPNGENFPQIRLVVNRNDTQQRIARSVARMWKTNLNLETLVIVKEASEIEAVKTSGDYDLIRRGVVLPTADEMVSLTAVFGTAVKTVKSTETEAKPGESDTELFGLPLDKDKKGGPFEPADSDAPNATPPAIVMLTEGDAIYELNAIPLYFPMSYSLVKPFVKGFEMNGLDAALLKDVSIDSNWQPKQ